MADQYDSIAVEYQRMKTRVLYRIVDYSLRTVIGNISGMNVLDLACGEGYTSRQFKSYGANKVVGVDVSAEMIRLAQEQEMRKPLGIKYLCSSAQTLDRLDEFDIVAGIFLLHYANDVNELFQICRVIYNNLKSGGRFIAANNKGLKKNFLNDFSEYDFRYLIDGDIQDGGEVKLIVNHEAVITNITTRHYSREIYNRALREAGFKKMEWVDFLVPPEVLNGPAGLKWDGFGVKSAEGLLICEK